MITVYSEPMQILVDEHEVITSVLDALEIALARTTVDDVFPQEFFEKAFDFFPTFADKYHHAKEEDALFPVMESRGVPREGGPIGCMLSDHDKGRRHVAAVRSALVRTSQGDQSAREIVLREAGAYLEMLRSHIRKENEILFILGDHYLTTEDKQQLALRFDGAHHSPNSTGMHEKYLSLAKELSAWWSGAVLQD